MTKKLKQAEFLLECGLKDSVVAQLPRQSMEYLALIAMDLSPLNQEKRTILIQLAFMMLGGKPAAALLVQQGIVSMGQLKEIDAARVEEIAADYAVHQDKIIASKAALRAMISHQNDKLSKRYIASAVNHPVLEDEDDAR